LPIIRRRSGEEGHWHVFLPCRIEERMLSGYLLEIPN
jgi:hypothetical protein